MCHRQVPEDLITTPTGHFSHQPTGSNLSFSSSAFAPLVLENATSGLMFSELYPASRRWSGHLPPFHFSEPSGTLTLLHSKNSWEQVAPTVHFKGGPLNSDKADNGLASQKWRHACERRLCLWVLLEHNSTKLVFPEMGSAKHQFYGILKKTGVP